MIDGFYTAEEIKPLLGIKARPGDLRTLNKYVKNGKSVGRKAVPVRFRPSAPPYKPPLSAVL